MHTRNTMPLSLRLALDAVTGGVFIVSFGPRLSGAVLHEWLGVAFFVLLLSHIAINRRWFTTLFRGRFTMRRGVNTGATLALLIAVTVLLGSGILGSAHIFTFGALNNGMELRRIHSVAAYWCLVLTGIHAGLYWKIIVVFMHNVVERLAKRRVSLLSGRIPVTLLVLYGIWASFDRDIGSKLFLGFSFDFWPPERPVFLFYMSIFAVMSVYIFAARYVSSFLARKKIT